MTAITVTAIICVTLLGLAIIHEIGKGGRK